MKSIISEGKTSNEAIEKGLKELGCTKQDVDIKILENEEKRSFYSILAPRIVKVELTLKENVEKNIEKNIERPKVNTEEKILSEENYESAKEDLIKFLDSFSKVFGELEYEINKNKNLIEITITGENSSKLIGYRGDIINSIQTVLSAIANKNTNDRVRISLDICDYKSKRENTLKELAKKLEKTVLRTKRKVVLEPMTAYERKILHTELQNSRNVITYSIGEEPHRKLVVDLKK